MPAAEGAALLAAMVVCADMAALSAVAKQIKAANYDASDTKILKDAYAKARDRINAPATTATTPPESTGTPSEPLSAPQATDSTSDAVSPELKWLMEVDSIFPEIVKECLAASSLDSIEAAAESVLFKQVKKAINEMTPND